MPNPAGADDTSQSFQSLIKRSLEACASVYFGPEDKKHAQLDAVRRQLEKLRNVDDVLTGREFWFFQRREAFLAQQTMTQWSPVILDDYVLLPMRDEFINRKDCVFVSHVWNSPAHPDPSGEELRKLQTEMRKSKNPEYPYFWLDFTCLPQYPREDVEERYAYDCRELIANLIHHCHFAWARLPNFVPRAWILYEVAEAFFLSTSDGPQTYDLEPYWNHLQEMRELGVRPVLEMYGYKCSIPSDLDIIMPRLAVAVILKSLTADITLKQECVDQAVLKRSRGLQYTEGRDTIFMNHYNGEMEYHGMILRFPPFPKPGMDKAKHKARHERRLREETAAVTGQDLPLATGRERKGSRGSGGFREWLRRNFSGSYTT